MSTQPSRRRGHAGIRAITEDMVSVLPPENTQKPAYMRAHTTFGLIKRCLDLAEQGNDPARQYKELQHLEQTLRARLDALNPHKPIPAQMLRYLDELRDAVREALDGGVDTEFLVRSFEDMLVAPEPSLEEKMARRPPKMVPEKRLKEVWEELKVAKARNQKLNQENNELVVRLKRAEAEIARLGGRGTGWVAESRMVG